MGYPYPYYRRVRDSYDSEDMFLQCLAKCARHEDDWDSLIQEIRSGAIASVIYANRTLRKQCYYVSDVVMFRADIPTYVDEWSMINNHNDNGRYDCWRKLFPLANGFYVDDEEQIFGYSVPLWSSFIEGNNYVH